MKPHQVLALVAVALAALTYPTAGQAPPSDLKNSVSAENYYDGKSAYWADLRQYVQDTNTVHIGMTRGDLEKVFHEADGFHQFQWVYNRSPHVIMDVQFDSGLLSYPRNSQDKVKSLSKPYWKNDGRPNPN